MARQKPGRKEITLKGIRRAHKKAPPEARQKPGRKEITLKGIRRAHKKAPPVARQKTGRKEITLKGIRRIDKKASPEARQKTGRGMACEIESGRVIFYEKAGFSSDEVRILRRRGGERSFSFCGGYYKNACFIEQIHRERYG